MAEYRDVSGEDWHAILRLADASLEGVAGAPSQEEWLGNRRNFPESGTRRHFVAADGDVIAGYAAIERLPDTPKDVFRLFVVTVPQMRQTLGKAMLRELRRHLLDAGTRRVRMVEFEADTEFRAFLRACGFRESQTFAMADGTSLVELVMDAPFAALA